MNGDERERFPLAEAEAIANRVVDYLSDVCDRIAIGGSIRRGRPSVADIEIVAIARHEMRDEAVDMFTVRQARISLLEERCADLLRRGVVVPRLDKNGRQALGGKYKRLLFDDFPLDLFITTEECWGTILLLRTGPAEFNQRLVLKRSEGGWLTRGFFFRDGRLWKLPPPYDAAMAPYAESVPTPTEESVFTALGYAYVPPEARGETRPPLLTAVPA